MKFLHRLFLYTYFGIMASTSHLHHVAYLSCSNPIVMLVKMGGVEYMNSVKTGYYQCVDAR